MWKEEKFVHVGRIIFIISNISCLISGITLLGTGIGTRLMINGRFNTEVNGLSSVVKAAFGLEYDKSVSIIPLVDDVMITLSAFGAIFIIISLCAFAAAFFKFIILVLSFIPVVLVVTAMFLNRDSSACFDKIFKVIEENKAAAILPLILTLIILVGESIFAFLMLREMSRH